MNHNNIVVFDLETTGVDTKTCQITQIAAVALNPRTLSYTDADKYSTFVRPEDFDSIDQGNIDFHCKAQGCTQEELLKTWREAPSAKIAWKDFVGWLEGYTRGKGFTTCPIPAGYNIKGYDLPIIRRYAKKFGNVDKEGIQKLFHRRDMFDLMDFINLWFENSKALKNYKLDTVREYFGISKEGAHDALKDVLDTALMLRKFIELHRRQFPRIMFKDSLKLVSA